MARKRKDLEPVDIAAADALLSAMKEAGISQRQVARESGMSLNRVGIILRKEPPPATIGEIDAMSGPLGVTASSIVGQAERSLRSPLKYVSETAVSLNPDDYEPAAHTDVDVEAEQEAMEELP